MRHFIILILLILCQLSYGQKKELLQLSNFDKSSFRYGFYLGLHNKGYDIKATDAKINSGAGFHLGVLADWRLTNHLNLLTEPGIVSSNNNLEFAGEVTPMNTTHFHLPIYLKINTLRINNVRAFVLGGISYNYNFTAERNNNDNGANPRDFKLTRHNAFAEIGIGANFYFDFFKFSPSIRGLYGFQNEFVGLGDVAKNSLSSLQSRGVFLTLTFQ